jgi:hypothetical protein
MFSLILLALTRKLVLAYKPFDALVLLRDAPRLGVTLTGEAGEAGEAFDDVSRHMILLCNRPTRAQQQDASRYFLIPNRRAKGREFLGLGVVGGEQG